MFTGIITAVSPIVSSRSTEEGLEMEIQTPSGWSDIEMGESINTNGVCLTVVSLKKDTYGVLLVPETLAKTTFGLHVPSQVNLERALSVADRFGGHFVQGHVDTTGIIAGIDTSAGYVLKVAIPHNHGQLVIAKGSITIDGVALTVITCRDDVCSVALIPHTLLNTTLRLLRPQDSVNLEFDMLGKYVINFMEQRENATR